MSVRFGQPVLISEAPWGEVSGIIIEPSERRLTHLVVEPAGRHDQARLVPLARVTVDDEARAVLSVSGEELRRLPLVRDSTYQRPSRPVLPGRDWDVGVRETPSEPRYSFRDVPRSEFDDERTVEIVFDRIPKQTIELRAESGFELAEGDEVGRVAGVTIDVNGRVTEISVLRLPRLLRQMVVVSGEQVIRYQTDRLTSSLDRAAFAALPRNTVQRRRRT